MDNKARTLVKRLNRLLDSDGNPDEISKCYFQLAIICRKDGASHDELKFIQKAVQYKHVAFRQKQTSYVLIDVYRHFFHLRLRNARATKICIRKGFGIFNFLRNQSPSNCYKVLEALKIELHRAGHEQFASKIIEFLRNRT